MKLLLDSKVFLWWLSCPRRLSDQVQGSICDVRNDSYVSSASLWELQIKAAQGKMQMPLSLIKLLKDQKFSQLPISSNHVEHASKLPAIHSDPFDRILIAQALCDDMTLVTNDQYIQQYEVPLMTA